MPGLLRGVARTAVIAGTATAVSNRVSRRQGRRWAEQEQQAYATSPQYVEPAPQYVQPAPAAPAASGESDRIAELGKLGELHSEGILTDEEFAAEKAKILGL